MEEKKLGNNADLKWEIKNMNNNNPTEKIYSAAVITIQSSLATIKWVCSRDRLLWAFEPSWYVHNLIFVPHFIGTSTKQP